MDIEKGRLEARQWHEEFVRHYHKDNPEVMMNLYEKYDHTHRVVIEVRGLISALNLEENTATIAELGALFHDIERYKLLSEGNRFDAVSDENHAGQSLLILQDEGALQYLPRDIAEAVCQIILLHNAPTIPKSLDEKTDLALKMVRDADRLDLLRLFSLHYAVPKESRTSAVEFDLPEGDTVKKSIRDMMANGSVVKECLIENITELKMQQISWAYDFNIRWTSQVVSRRQYIGKIVETLPDDSELRDLAGQAIRFIDAEAEKAQAEGFRGR